MDTIINIGDQLCQMNTSYHPVFLAILWLLNDYYDVLHVIFSSDEKLACKKVLSRSLLVI